MGWSMVTSRTRDTNFCIPEEKEMAMKALVNAVKKFVCNEDGVTAIEYGLIAALVAVVIISAVTLMGTKVAATFNSVAAAL